MDNGHIFQAAWSFVLAIGVVVLFICFCVCVVSIPKEAQKGKNGDKEASPLGTSIGALALLAAIVLIGSWSYICYRGAVDRPGGEYYWIPDELENRWIQVDDAGPLDDEAINSVWYIPREGEPLRQWEGEEIP